MAREKVTVMLDRNKVETARSLTGAGPISDVIDRALDRLIERAWIEHDVDAYRRQPPADEELAFVDLPVAFDLDDDDIDYDALYGDEA